MMVELWTMVDVAVVVTVTRGVMVAVLVAVAVKGVKLRTDEQ